MMFVGHQLIVLGQCFQRIFFPHQAIRIVGQVVEYLRPQYKEPPIDPSAIAHKFFTETRYALIFVEAEEAKPARRLDSRHRGDFPMGLMVCDQLFKINIGEPIAIGEHKLFVTYILLSPFQSTRRSGLYTCIHKRYPEFFRVGAVHLKTVRQQIDGNIGIVNVIIKEVFLDHVTLIADTDDKIVETLGFVYFHEMPQERLFTNFDHGFGFKIRLL